jgi:hypothetical protein
LSLYLNLVKRQSSSIANATSQLANAIRLSTTTTHRHAAHPLSCKSQEENMHTRRQTRAPLSTQIVTKAKELRRALEAIGAVLHALTGLVKELTLTSGAVLLLAASLSSTVLSSQPLATSVVSEMLA